MHLPDNILALASIIQVTALINDLANKGECDAVSCDASISSIYKNGDNISEIYDAEEDLVVGITMLKQVLTKSKNNRVLLMYFLGLIKVEKLLMKEKEMLKTIAIGIKEVGSADYVAVTSNDAIAKIAEIYRKTAGRLNHRIIINGEKNKLTNLNIVNHIRALLLAGIRSVSLWRTLGGNIWYLVFNKKKIIKMLNALNI